jgi:myo-inositol-hexaphosphate 3-phosphohydrolase
MKRLLSARPVVRRGIAVGALAASLLANNLGCEMVQPSLPDNGNRNTVADLEFLGEVTFPTGFTFDNTEVGGLSGIVFDQANSTMTTGAYVALSDDRSNARYYDLTIDLSDGSLDDGDVVFTGVTNLLDTDGQPFAANALDPEGLALTGNNTLYVTSEGDVNADPQIDPFVREYDRNGSVIAELPVPQVFLPGFVGGDPTADPVGPRNNLVFESATLTIDESILYTATENALFTDGPASTVDSASPARILAYGPDRQPLAQYIYEVDELPSAPIPPDAFATNGLVDLVAIDDQGTLLSMERAFAVGVGNEVKLFEVTTRGAVDVSSFDGIDGLEADPVAEKREIFDLSSLGLTLDNLEGMTFGPKLPDGRASLILVSDNNFNPNGQFTQFLAFAVDIAQVPVAQPAVETDRVLDDLATVPAGEFPGDSDDPAIWVHPTNPEASRVLGTLKQGGLGVADLNGHTLQLINPAGSSFNNVDVIYDYAFTDGTTSDIAIVSDRFLDTVAVFAIGADGTVDPTAITGQVPETIFGVDDAEATAYGLAAYTSPDTGKHYVFVTQSDGNQIAQLELVPGDGTVDGVVVRRLEAPVPAGADPADGQTEGVVADPDLGVVHIAMEEGIGILTFDAEPDGGTDFELLYDAADELLVPDIEGLDLYLGAGTSGYIVASSQGDSTFHVWQRDGDRDYVGSFAVGANDALGIDATDESDGLDIVSAPLGGSFPKGLIVVHDGQNQPQFTNVDGDEIENASTNFTFVSWAEVAHRAGLDIDTSRPAR